MPLIGLLHLLIAIGFALHAHNTGRPQIWLYILIFVPLVGSVAYVLFELLPELAGSRRMRAVARDVSTVVDPDREFRRLSADAAMTDTVVAKLKLGEELERKRMWPDAVALYERAAEGIFAHEPDVLRALARAQLGNGDPKAALDVLARLKAAHPNYQNQDAHLTFARSLEELGQLREAETEYRSLGRYFVGLEARGRHALLLRRLGEPAEARQLLDEIVRVSKARGVILSDGDREWVRLARNS